MKNVKKVFFVMVLVLCCMFSTGCGVNDATETFNHAKDSAVEAASDAKDKASWWTRKTQSQSWTNPSTGTEIEIKEDRKSGNFLITVRYTNESIEDSWEGCKTKDAIVTMVVDQVTDDLIDDLRDE